MEEFLPQFQDSIAGYFLAIPAYINQDAEILAAGGDIVERRIEISAKENTKLVI